MFQKSDLLKTIIKFHLTLRNIEKNDYKIIKFYKILQNSNCTNSSKKKQTKTTKTNKQENNNIKTQNKVGNNLKLTRKT